MTNLEEVKAIGVQDRLPAESVPYDVISVTKLGRTHLSYRWKENGIDHILSIAINSPTIVVEDIQASLFVENDDTSTVGAENKTNKT